MNRVAVAFSTKDRTELSVRSIEPLLQPERFDCFWIDGSTTDEGKELPYAISVTRKHHINVQYDVRGGADAAIVYALTTMLKGGYTHIGLVENDGLLDHDWFEPTMALFEQGRQDGLNVGAVSARCYQDRILIQRPDYAIMHNLGAGMIMFTREAAKLALQSYRTTFTMENRHLFCLLSGLDIGAWWAFGNSPHWLVADWGIDKVLASHGYASLALVPNKVQMLAEDIATQGLAYAERPVEQREDDEAFERYRASLNGIRDGEWDVRRGESHFYRDAETGQSLIFPHQLADLGGRYTGDWRLKWSQGFGPFSWIAHGNSTIAVDVLGPCAFLIGGGKTGGTFKIIDSESGFTAAPALPASDQDQVISAGIPGGVSYRTITLDMTPGTVFYGLTTQWPQPWVSAEPFSHATLPPA